MRTHKKEIVIGFAGDTMLGRLVNKKMDHVGYTYVWGNVLPILKKNNINIINLETTLTKSEKKVPKVFNFKATPDSALNILNQRLQKFVEFYNTYRPHQSLRYKTPMKYYEQLLEEKRKKRVG